MTTDRLSLLGKQLLGYRWWGGCLTKVIWKGKTCIKAESFSIQIVSTACQWDKEMREKTFETQPWDSYIKSDFFFSCHHRSLLSFVTAWSGLDFAKKNVLYASTCYSCHKDNSRLSGTQQCITFLVVRWLLKLRHWSVSEVPSNGGPFGCMGWLKYWCWWCLHGRCTFLQTCLHK